MKQLPWPDVVWMSAFICPLFLFFETCCCCCCFPSIWMKSFFCFVNLSMTFTPWYHLPKGSAATHWWLSRGGSCPWVLRYVVDTFDRSPFWNNISQLYELYELYQHLSTSINCIKECILWDVSTEHGTYSKNDSFFGFRDVPCIQKYAYSDSIDFFLHS